MGDEGSEDGALSVLDGHQGRAHSVLKKNVTMTKTTIRFGKKFEIKQRFKDLHLHTTIFVIMIVKER